MSIRYCDHSHVEVRSALTPPKRLRVRCSARAVHLFTPDGAGNYLALCDAHYRLYMEAKRRDIPRA